MKNEYPKMMMVSHEKNFRHHCITNVLGIVNNMFICVDDGDIEIEDITEDTDLVIAKYAKDIEPKEEEKEVKHLLKEGDCVETNNKETYLMLCALCDKLGINRHSKMVDYYDDGYKNIIFEENAIVGVGARRSIISLTIPQFINKMIGVEEKPKVIHETINGVDIEFKNNKMFINHRDVKIVFREENVKEMLHTLEEMK